MLKLFLLVEFVVYLALITSGTTQAQVDVITVENIPSRIFQANAQIEVDRAGHIFVMATTNAGTTDPAQGGVVVWRQDAPGAPLVQVLAPGQDQAYVGGHLSVDIWGDLRMTASNRTRTVIRSWRVPGWVK